MNLLICGTAAAEGWPALFCHCEPCQEARRRGGKNIRSRAAYQLGDHIRIDFGPDSNLHQQKYGLAYEKLQHLLMSHSHWDHWAPRDISMRQPGFAAIPESAILHVYGNEKVRSFLEVGIGPDFERHHLEFHLIQVGERYPLSDGVVAMPVAAAHDRSEICVNWILEWEGCRLLQGHDTGWWDPETWDVLAQNPLDIIILDCTYGSIANRSGHLGCQDVLDVFARLDAIGGLKPGARKIATHFSHNGHWLHEQLEEFFRPHGVEVAYDGMSVPMARSGLSTS